MVKQFTITPSEEHEADASICNSTFKDFKDTFAQSKKRADIGNLKQTKAESALEKNYNKPLQMLNSSPPGHCKENDIYPNPFMN